MFDSGMIMKEKLEASHSLGFKGYQGDHALMLLAVNKSHNQLTNCKRDFVIEDWTLMKNS